MSDQMPQTIAGRYELRQMLGRSSSGADIARTVWMLEPWEIVSWRAFDINQKRNVFIKVLSSNTPDFIKQAHLDTWNSMARLSIVGMPSIIDICTGKTEIALVTEWLDAVPLHAIENRGHRLAGDAQTITETILTQALETLATLHASGLVHGDISPSNILVSKSGDEVWLIDPAPVIGRSAIMTTPYWAAPEVLAGKSPHPTSDLYALGAVLMEFAKRNLSTTLRIVEQLASPDPAQRPQSAAEARLRFLRSGEWREPTSRWDTGFADVDPRSPNMDGGPLFNRLEPQTNATQTATYGSPWGQMPATPASTAEVWTNRTEINHVPVVLKKGGQPIEADFIAMGPPIVVPGSTFPLELWTGPSDKNSELRERAHERGRLSNLGGRSGLTLPGSALMTAQINLPGFKVVNPVEHLQWDGTIRNVSYIIKSDRKHREGEYWGTIKLILGSNPLGMVSFCVCIKHQEVSTGSNVSELNGGFQRFKTAFASYASEERSEVFKRVQAIRASQIDIFSDIADLRGGDRWEDVLMREIANRDIFYLFWSRKAANSKWVEREWRRAVDTRGAEFICPIPLEDPRVVKPPAELSQLHFNDWCLAIIAYEETMAESSRDK